MRSIIGKNRYNRKGLEIGYWEYYYGNGSLDSKGSYKDGMKDGIWEEYSKGYLYSKGSYKNGLMDGMWEYYYENGKLWYNGYYKEGVRI